jgi:hypothetical protein
MWASRLEPDGLARLAQQHPLAEEREEPSDLGHGLLEAGSDDRTRE